MAKWFNAAVCKTDTRRFKSGLRLPEDEPEPLKISPGGGMVDTKDLKSFGGNAVRVRVPPGALWKYTMG